MHNQVTMVTGQTQSEHQELSEKSPLCYNKERLETDACI